METDFFLLLNIDINKDEDSNKDHVELDHDPNEEVFSSRC